MRHILDLDRYPLDREGSSEWNALVETAVAAIAANGMCNLEGLVRPEAIEKAVAEVGPVVESGSYRHERMHNIYFKSGIAGLAPDHPALRKVSSVHHTVCADQISGSIPLAIYEYAPLLRFLAAAMGKASLHIMEDPLARVNIMSSRHGEGLNWHFDQSEFTTTLLLQASDEGGELEYCKDLRSANDPNYDGVARLLEGHDRQTTIARLSPGALNIFRGINTAHRVTTIEGQRDRMVAVFAYFEKPGVVFNADERVGFYGRAA